MAIKTPPKTGKISRLEIRDKALEEPHHPVFCFRYLTQNKTYNFSKDGDKTRSADKAKANLLMHLHFLSTRLWEEIRGWDKSDGYETECLDIKTRSQLDVGKDEKYTIFRFKVGAPGERNGGNGRIVGKLAGPLLQVLFIDWDLSLYKHNK